MAVFGWIAAIGLLWVLGDFAWICFSGPQNLPGWVFFASLPINAALVGRVVAWSVERRRA